MLSTLVASGADARPARPAPPLPPPTGTIVNVSTEPQLQAAIQALTSNTTIVLAPGTYVLTSTVWISGTFTDVGIRGATNNSDDVTLVGPGMTQASFGNVPFGIWTGGNVQGVTIANLTVRNVYYHPIIFNAGTQRPHVYNVRVVDAGEQLLKANPDSTGKGVDDGLVEYSIFEYTTTAPSDYTNGVDVVGGANWIIRNNLFRNIVAPPGQLAGPSILMWKGAANTVSEGNTFVNCARGISYGLDDVAGFDHQGGIIRNNFFSRTNAQAGDVGIYVGDSPNTQVLNNTVLLSGTYSAAIEYRFPDATGVTIVNNLTDAPIVARDGGTASVRDNFTAATSGMFVNAAAGDLHLADSAIAAIDQGETLASVVDDWDGAARPQGIVYDIGADERGATTSASYAIGGRITDSSTFVAIDGVTVTLGGSQSRTTTSDQNGAYTFSGLAAGGDYVVTPSLAGDTFTPSSAYFTTLGANQTADFLGTAAPAAVNQPPTVSLTAPSSGASFPARSDIALAASAADADGVVTKVTFFADSTAIGVSTSGPNFTATWKNAPAGTYVLTAVATDDDGATTTSQGVTIAVVKKQRR